MENELDKMTAVQWFIEQLEQKGDASENVSIRRIQISVDVSDYLKLIRQAKQMEKDQIINAFWDGGANWDSEKTAEQHYNEKYGGNK